MTLFDAFLTCLPMLTRHLATKMALNILCKLGFIDGIPY